MGNGAEDWRNSALDKRAEQLRINLRGLDITHKAVVERLGIAPLGWYHIAVSTRETESIAPLSLQHCHNALVEQACVDHRHHLECRSVGHTPTLDHRGRNLELLCQARSQLTTAVNENLGRGYRGEVAHKLRQCLLVVDDVTSYLNNRYLHLL